MSAPVHAVVKRRASIRVRWVMRFAGWGLAHVLWYDRFGNNIDCVRVHGSVVDSKDAKRFALDAKAGRPLPSWVEAYV